MDIKIEHMREFLKERDKVRLTIVFRGREMEHRDVTKPLVDRVKEKIMDIASIEQDGEMEGTRMHLLFVPKR